MRLLLLFSFFLWTALLQAQNIFDAEHRLTYARNLSQTGNYHSAAREYESLMKSGDISPEILDEALDAFRKVDACDNIFFLLSRNLDENKLRKKYRRDFIVSALKTEKYEKARQETDNLYKINPRAAAEYELAQYILTAQYHKASRKASQNNEPQVLQLKALADSLQNIKFKSPIILGLSAAILPGSGHMAAGNNEAGMQYLFMIAVNSFQTYKVQSISHKNNVFTLAFVGISAALYLGNIYGAVNQARYYNRETEKAIRKQVFDILDKQ